MGIAPGAIYKPLAEVNPQPKMAAHDLIILHTMVGSLTSCYRFFLQNGYGGTESHHGIGYDGTDYQFVDDMYRADANLEANPHAISIETADKGTGFPDWTGENVPPWTQAQLNRIIFLLVHYCRKFNIPPVLVPDSRPGRRGIGYHRQGIDGNLPDMRVAGGEVWSTARGKICPGNARIKQLKEIVIPAVAKQINGPGGSSGGGSGEVTQEQFQALMAQSISNTKISVATGKNVAALMEREAKNDATNDAILADLKASIAKATAQLTDVQNMLKEGTL